MLRELFSSTKRIVIKIIPHQSTSIYKVEMSHRHAAVVVAALLLVAGAIGVFQIGAVRAAEAQLHELQAADARQHQQLVVFSHKTQDMMHRLKVLQHDEGVIKRLAGISTTAKPQKTAPRPATKSDVPSPAQAAYRLRPTQMSAIWNTVRSWLGGSDDGAVTFATESSELALLDVKLNESLADTGALKSKEEAVAAARVAAALAHERYLDSIPSMWPTDGYVSSGFGYRTYPDVEFHPGLDVVNDYGAPIYATASGVVEEAGWDDGGYGYKVVIDHGNGYETWYAHDSRILVNAGDTVRKGEEIALVGDTGFATGPHCHYELLLWGTPIDPTPFLDGVPAKLADAH